MCKEEEVKYKEDGDIRLWRKKVRETGEWRLVVSRGLDAFANWQTDIEKTNKTPNT